MDFTMNRLFKYLVLFLCTITSQIVHGETLTAANAISATPQSLDAVWENRAQKSTQEEILKFLKSNPTIPNDFETSWRMARLAYFIGHFGLGETLKQAEQMQVFDVGYRAAEIAKNLEPKRVEGYYWYAINIGKYSLAKGKLTALKNAKLGRDTLLKAAQIDPAYHWGGPYRVLGKYYQDVPSGISFGDKKIAEEYFKKAIEISPNFRLNFLYLSRLSTDKKLKMNLLELAEKKADLDGSVEEKLYKNSIAKEINQLQ